MAGEPSPPAVDLYKLLQLIPNLDGSYTRLDAFPIVPPTPSPTESISTTTESTSPQLVHSKDVPLNPTNQTSIRLFKPHPLPPNPNLPLIFYFHGGGFVLFSAASEPFHVTCSSMALSLNAVIASVEYRLAPEYPLPAAYDDAVDAVIWARHQASNINGCDPWLKGAVDFSNIFLMGSSSGSNIIYHAGLRVSGVDLSPIKIQGLIFNQPFFGGAHRSESEMRSIDDQILPLATNDLMWAMSLPKGVGRDHEYSNPTAKGGDGRIGQLPRCLVSGYCGDPLVDRQREFAALLTARGVDVVAEFDDGGFHGVELFVPSKAQVLFDIIKDFIQQKPSNSISLDM